MTRAAWGALVVFSSACTLPFVAKTAERSVSGGGVRLTIGPSVTVTQRTVTFELLVDNDTDERLVIPPDGFTLQGDETSRPVLQLDDDGHLVVEARQRLRRTFVAVAGDERRFVVMVTDAMLGEQPVTLEPLELASPTAPLRDPAPTTFHLRLRLLGGALITRTTSSPLLPPSPTIGGPTGTLELVFGGSIRWFEANVVLRGGNGRLAALEVGLRPGLDWLTLLASYGVDFVQVNGGVLGELDLLFGHGPRLAVEVAFDARTVRLGLLAPRRFGAFLGGGLSSLAGRVTPAHLTGSVEAGLRWQLF